VRRDQLADGAFFSSQPGTETMSIVLPVETDYPAEVFRTDLPPELRVGCGRAYFKRNVVVRRIFRRRIEAAFALLPPRQWEHALDAGTGAGFLLPALSALAREVDGVDLSPVLRYTQSMLENRKISNVRLQVADLLNLPFSAGTFDLIACLSVIEHIPDPTAAFRELRRVLREDGTLIIGYPLEHAVFRGLETLSKVDKGLRRLVRRESTPRGEWFHPHASDYHRIERSWDGLFRVDALRNIRAVGIPLYRVLRLVKTA
jgi:SAM-dependent methyltransferase